jgi:ParE-like toxin of type II ParDE toxin-antitoxin system
VRFEFAAAAEWELDDAVNHYNQQRAGLGDEFVAEVGRAVDQVLAHPHAWQVLDADLGIRRCRLNRFPYGLVYRIEGDIAVALAVMYLRREPEYWKDRLKSK